MNRVEDTNDERDLLQWVGTCSVDRYLSSAFFGHGMWFCGPVHFMPGRIDARESSLLLSARVCMPLARLSVLI